MIEIGKHNQLEVLRHTSVGIYLGDSEGEDVLLPNKYCPKDAKVGDTLEVFVYLDSEERKVATNLQPKIKLGEFALLRAVAKTSVGVFLDWGLEKELMVPYSEQRVNMEEDRSYIVYLGLDKITNRLYGSNKIEKFLIKEGVTLEVGEKVQLLIYKKSDFGYDVIINNTYKGLVYTNEIFKKINIGEVMDGYVKNIREDEKIDISLSPIGYEKAIENDTDLILRKIKENNGSLALNDKTSPEEIYKELGISKKAFKKAIGGLYREKKIEIGDKGISLV